MDCAACEPAQAVGIEQSCCYVQAGGRDGAKRAGLKALLRGLKTGLDPVARLKEAQRVLDDHRHNVYDVLSKEDPGPALGVFFPLAAFLKNGRVNLDRITGEGGTGADGKDK